MRWLIERGVNVTGRAALWVGSADMLEFLVPIVENRTWAKWEISNITRYDSSRCSIGFTLILNHITLYNVVASENFPAVVDVLLRNRADINLVNNSGQTPLENLELHDSPQSMIEFLVMRGGQKRSIGDPLTRL